MYDLEVDLSDVRRACVEGQAQRVLSSHRAVEVAAVEGVTQAKARRRYKDRTGGLTAKALGRAVEATPQGGLAEMTWDAPYASFVDEGTRPHEIRPKRRTFLRFSIGGGPPIFARVVRHPGTRAAAFTGDAETAAERALTREVEASFLDLEKILNR